MTDGSGAATDSYTYDAYGTLTDHTGSSNTSFLYTGEQFDSETGDYYLRARYYSPQMSRFTQRDTYEGTAGSPITQNHYLYGNANPVMYTDPSGYVSMLSLTGSMSIMNTLSGLYTVGSIGVQIGTGNYTGAAKDILEELAYSRLGFIRPVGALSNRAIGLFGRMFANGKIPKLRRGKHNSQSLAINMQRFGLGSANGNAAHHIIGNGKSSQKLQAILSKAKIHTNSPLNGVFLPNAKRKWQTNPSPSGVPHIGGHTKKYTDDVEKILTEAIRGKNPGTKAYKAAVVNALSEIRLKLLTGIQPL